MHELQLLVEAALRLHEMLVDLINVGWSLKLANSISLSVLTEHFKNERRKKISDEKFMALFLAYGAETCSCGKHEVAPRHGWDENFPFHKIHIQFSTQINLNGECRQESEREWSI